MADETLTPEYIRLTVLQMAADACFGGHKQTLEAASRYEAFVVNGNATVAAVGASLNEAHPNGVIALKGASRAPKDN